MVPVRRLVRSLASPDTHPLCFRTTIRCSDGSTFTCSTTTPVKPLVQMVKDTRNHALWNPSSRTVDDRTGAMQTFAKRFGGAGDLGDLGA
jgi:ribosomal protein L31